MTGRDTELAEARQKIDDIDRNLHELLMRRAEIVTRVGALKADGAAAGGFGAYYRPDREAAVLAALMARHDGPFPTAALARIWREIMAASLAMQHEFSLVTAAGDDGLRTLARDYFGVTVPVRTAPSARAAVEIVAGDPGAIALVPWPDERESEAWWPVLATHAAKSRARIRAALRPLGALDADGPPAALVLAAAPEGESVDGAAGGAVHCFVALRAAADAAVENVVMALAEHGLNPRRLLHGRGVGQFLAEMPVALAEDDARLAALKEGGVGVMGATVLGGFSTAPASGS